jgi:hypothetical protein
MADGLGEALAALMGNNVNPNQTAEEVAATKAPSQGLDMGNVLKSVLSNLMGTPVDAANAVLPSSAQIPIGTGSGIRKTMGGESSGNEQIAADTLANILPAAGSHVASKLVEGLHQAAREVGNVKWAEQVVQRVMDNVGAKEMQSGYQAMENSIGGVAGNYKQQFGNVAVVPKGTGVLGDMGNARPLMEQVIQGGVNAPHSADLVHRIVNPYSDKVKVTSLDPHTSAMLYGSHGGSLGDVASHINDLMSMGLFKTVQKKGK